MRLPGSPIESDIWSALGALPTSLSWNKVYSGIQRGVVEGFESTISGYTGSKLYEVAQLDLVHLGIITCLTLACGMVTPPYGICLLIATQIGEISTIQAFVSVIRILVIKVGIILLGVFIPDLFLFLPNWLMADV